MRNSVRIGMKTKRPVYARACAKFKTDLATKKHKKLKSVFADFELLCFFVAKNWLLRLLLELFFDQ